jgi:hypothetical protein
VFFTITFKFQKEQEMADSVNHQKTGLNTI